MGRRLAAGVAGTSGLGTLSVTSSTISTTTTNGDLTLDPNGTGGVLVVGDLTLIDQSDLRLRESSGNGTNYLAMQAAANMAANYTITWPSAVAGGAGYYLASDTNGTLSWSPFPTAGLTTSDPGSSATVHYPLFETNAGSVPSGSVTTLKAKNNLTFIPSTGELFSSIGHHPNVYGSTSSSGTITIRGTSNGTKAAASVLMTDNVASTTTGTGTLVVTGGVGISGQMTATTIVETSSIAFKENINPIENALDLVMQLSGVTYDRKDNKEHEAGLIAEQVYMVAPDLVSLDKNGNPYGIKYTKLGAYLLESIKSLKQELDTLKK